jgi:phosphatidylinositol 4-kinase
VELDEFNVPSKNFRITGSFAPLKPKGSPRIMTQASSMQTLTDRDLEDILNEANDQLVEERKHDEFGGLSARKSSSESENVSKDKPARPHYESNYVGTTLSSLDVYNLDAPAPRRLFNESFRELAQKVRKQSPFGQLKSWRLVSVIVKAGDDLRQEQLAMQLISLFDQIFKEAKLRVWLRPYDILATETDCGLIECVTNAMSIDSIKKSLPQSMNSLRDFFLLQFGPENSKLYKTARKAFMESLAGYSLVCYMLQIKDRHNGNILLDSQGHLVHIDFGFMLSNSPGDMNFESAPFKLSQDFVEVMGGPRSTAFVEFRGLIVKGYKALRRQRNKISLLLEMLRSGVGSSLPCFSAGEEAVIALKARLSPRPKMTGVECATYMNSLIDESLLNWRTRWYDRYQYWCQNIF